MTVQTVTRYVRYTTGGDTSYGVIEGDAVHQLQGDLFDVPQRRSGVSAKLVDVQLLVPVDPARTGKVVGVTGNHDTPVRSVPCSSSSRDCSAACS